MATTTVPILSLSSIPKSDLVSSLSFSIACNSKLRLPPIFSSKAQSLRQIVVPTEATRKWSVSAYPRNLLLLEADPVDNSRIMESAATDDGVNSIISALLFVAFIGLSILTIGVVYIAVTDFLQKREREKYEKEEAAKKKSGKKGKLGTRARARARAGPRGFGQKIEEEEEDE